MNLNKVSKQLRKINNLVEALQEDNHVSKIEKDLLLSYTRSLYEKMLENESADTNSTPTPSPRHEPKRDAIERHAPAKATVEEITRKEMDTAKTAVASPSSAPVYQAPIEEKAPVQSYTEPVQKTPSPQQAPAATETATATQEIEGSMREIFSERKANELSERLSHAPIADLTKCMGINEKILTVSELFGGDSTLYSTTLERLNSFDSFDQAKMYLANGVAKDLNWDNEEKMDKARNFVKLVQRRYA